MIHTSTSMTTKMKRLFRHMADGDIRKLMSFGGHVGFEIGSRDPVVSFGVHWGLAAVGHWAVAVEIETTELVFPGDLDPAPGEDPADEEGDVDFYPERWTRAATRNERKWLIGQCEFWAENMIVELVASEYRGVSCS